MGQGLIDRLLETNPEDIYVLVLSALRDPAANLTAFLLFIGAATVLVLLVILAVVLLFTSGQDEYEEYEEYEESGEYAQAAAPAAEPEEVAEPAEPKSPAARALAAGIWIAVTLMVLVAGGYVSGRDAICVSCHTGGGVHTARYQDPSPDPHRGVRCGDCHETSNRLASLTTAVPGRAWHFVAAVMSERHASGYGVPVANRSCAGCHRAALRQTVEDTERGILMSHAEPLDSRALCSDCHAIEIATGVVNRYIVGMEPCLRCHDEENVSAACDYCHTKDIAFAVRSRTFLESNIQVVDITCGGCHSEKACDACHGIRMPHSQDFKGAMHARAAVEDVWFNGGEMCRRCHSDTRNGCWQCHLGTFPAHPPGYMPKGHQSADPFSNGCDSCHWQMAWIRGRNFCGLCHPKWDNINPGREVYQ